MKTRVFTVCTVFFLFCGIAHAKLSDGLVAYYPFNGNANDESGNGNNGTVSGAILTADRFGQTGKSYGFDGQDDYILINDASNLKFISQFSIATWVRFNQVTRTTSHYCWQTFFAQPTHRQFGLMLETLTSEHRLVFYINSAEYTYNWMDVQPNTWYHVAVSYDGSQVKHYINGILKATNTASGSINSSGNFSLGKCIDVTYVYPLDGQLDDINIYSRSLSETEIQQLYQGQGMCSNSIVTFTAGTPAKAADVNANFDAHNCQIQALKAIVCQDHPTASICQ